MRQRCFAAMVLCFSTAGAFGQDTDGDKEARAVIDKAIKASGGEVKLDRLKSATMRIKGPFQVGLQVIEFAGECSFADLDRFIIDGNLEGKALRSVLTAENAWLKHEDKVESVHQDALFGVQTLLYATRAATLLVPLRDKDFMLALGGESKVGERPAVLVKAKHKNHGAIEFYFDNENGLPVKVTTRVKALDNEDVAWECVFADYKDVDGLRHFTHIIVVMESGSQKLSFDATLSDIQTAAKLKDGLFAKPE